MTFARTTYGVILAGTFLWCCGILLAPACVSAGGDLLPVGNALFDFYQPICHQIPERSIPFLDSHLGVCARCSAIYLSFFVGMLLYPIGGRLDRPSAPSRILLVIALLPVIVDAVGPGPLFYEVTNLTRAVTGGWLGILLPFVLLPIGIQAVHEIARDIASTPSLQKGRSNAE